MMVENGRKTHEKNLPTDDFPQVGVAAAIESVIGCKWSLQVLAAIREGINRPGELTRACEGISTKVLNERLTKLVRFGVLDRHAFAEIPPRVEYRLTDYGNRFVTIIDAVNRLQSELNTQLNSSQGELS